MSQVLTRRKDDALSGVLGPMEGAPNIDDRMAPDGNI